MTQTNRSNKEISQSSLFEFEVYSGLGGDARELAVQVENHLRNNIEGTEYVHARDLADEIDDVNTKQVAVVLPHIAEESRCVEVEEWSRTNATNWKVEGENGN